MTVVVVVAAVAALHYYAPGKKDDVLTVFIQKYHAVYFSDSQRIR